MSSFVVDNHSIFDAVLSEVRQGRSVRLRVKGTSMRPFLRSDSDMVEFSPFEASALKKGDVVLFFYRGQYYMHRILKREGEKLKIRGDGVLSRCEYPSTSDVLATVTQVFRLRKGGAYTSISCSSRLWRFYSFLWPSLPRLLRRFILHFC